MIFFTLIMAILFSQLLRGALYHCTDQIVHERLGCVGSFVADGGAIGGTLWQNNPRHYDNVLSSLLVMMELLTIEDWDNIMWAAVDSTDPDHGPIRDYNPGWSFAFMGYIILGSFFVMNLFVGVIVTAYNDAKTEADLSSTTLEKQDKRRVKAIKDTHDKALYAYHRTRNSNSKVSPLSRVAALRSVAISMATC